MNMKNKLYKIAVACIMLTIMEQPALAEDNGVQAQANDANLCVDAMHAIQEKTSYNFPDDISSAFNTYGNGYYRASYTIFKSLPSHRWDKIDQDYAIEFGGLTFGRDSSDAATNFQKALTTLKPEYGPEYTDHFGEVDCVFKMTITPHDGGTNYITERESKLIVTLTTEHEYFSPFYPHH